MPSAFIEWIAWGGIVLPLMVLSWSAYRYVALLQKETEHKEYQRFFLLMDQLGQNGGSIATKMAAMYELRKYPQYKDVIVRLCNGAEFEGPATKMLENEFDLTKKFFS